MRFWHSDDLWLQHPDLIAGALHLQHVHLLTAHSAATDQAVAIGRHTQAARARLAQVPEGEWPEIQAWRRVFSSHGLKPTQYRCAAEALLRRLRKDGSLPSLHPLVDLCNALSVAWGVPIAVFDIAGVNGWLEVRLAHGSESYVSFGGETERAEPGEVVFADEAGHAHARRWSHRQSARSAVRSETAEVLIVAEAFHPTARADVAALMLALVDAVQAVCRVGGSALLDAGHRSFDVPRAGSALCS